MQTIAFKNIIISFPTRLDELSDSQYKRLHEAYWNENEQIYIKLAYFLSIFKGNYSLFWWFLYNNYLIYALDFITFHLFSFKQEVILEADWRDIYRRITSIVDRFAEIDPEKNQFPFLTVNETTLIGPADGLKGFQFYRFRMTDYYFLRYLSSKDSKMLDFIVAGLYAPEKCDRISYETQYEARAALTALIPIQIKLSIFQFYYESRQILLSKNDSLFPKKPDEKNTEIDIMKIMEQYDSWEQVVLNMSETPADIAINYEIATSDMFAYLNYTIKKQTKL